MGSYFLRAVQHASKTRESINLKIDLHSSVVRAPGLVCISSSLIIRDDLTYSKVLADKTLSEGRLHERSSVGHLECILGGVDKEIRDNTGVFAYAKLSEQS